MMGDLDLYEVTAAGFDGGTDQTDDRVYWVVARSAEDVARACHDTGASFSCIRKAPLSQSQWFNVDFLVPNDENRLRYLLKNWQRITDGITP